MYEEDKDPNAVDIANEQNKKLNEGPPPGNYSGARYSNITSPEEDAKKEEKARALIDEVVTLKLKPLEDQLKLLPGIIQQTVIDVISKMQTQQQATQQPQQPTQPVQQTPISPQVIESLAPLLQKFLGNETPTSGNQAIMDMIVNSYMKKMRMEGESCFLESFGVFNMFC